MELPEMDVGFSEAEIQQKLGAMLLDQIVLQRYVKVLQEALRVARPALDSVADEALQPITHATDGVN